LFPILPFIGLCMIDGAVGEHPRGVAVLDAALGTYPSFQHDTYSRAYALGTAVYFEAMGGAWTEARARADQLMDLARQLRNPSVLATALGALGFVLVDTDPDAAIAALEESVALTRAGATDGAFGPSLGELARLHAQAGDLPSALDVLRSAVIYTRDVGDHLTTSAGLSRAVEILAAAGHDEAAVVLSSAVSHGELASQMLALVEQQQPLLDQLRSRLGDDRYEAAHARGARLNYDDAVQYALAEIDKAVTELELRDT
jgi:hypothetical protein